MRHRIERRRAAILTLFVLLLPVLLILLGFSVDSAYMQLVETEIRVATDNAARAAADTLSRTESMAQARRDAIRVAREYTVAGKPLVLEDGDIDFGRSEPDNNEVHTFTLNADPPNAVKIKSAFTSGSANGSVPLFFGRLVGIGPFEPSQSATAAFLNVDICLVLDRSSSMKLSVSSGERGMSLSDSRFCLPPGSGTRWEALDAAVQSFAGILEANRADEQVALVTYGSDLDTIQPGLCGRRDAATLDFGLTTNIVKLRGEMTNLSNSVWNGATMIEAGINMGIEELARGHGRRRFSEKVMIVLTDGFPTSGDAVAAGGRAAAEDIRVHTITFGIEADRDHMRAVAAAGRGEHAHADNQTDLEAIFARLAAKLTQIVQ